MPVTFWRVAQELLFTAGTTGDTEKNRKDLKPRITRSGKLPLTFRKPQGREERKDETTNYTNYTERQIAWGRCPLAADI